MKKIIKGLAVTATTFAAVATLAACVPGDSDKAKAKLEKEGYVVVKDETVAGLLKLAGVKEIETLNVATKDSEVVTYVYFSTSSAAKDAYDTIKEQAKKNDSKVEAKRSGKVIYYGTETAMKDFN